MILFLLSKMLSNFIRLFPIAAKIEFNYLLYQEKNAPPTNCSIKNAINVTKMGCSLAWEVIVLMRWKKWISVATVST